MKSECKQIIVLQDLVRAQNSRIEKLIDEVEFLNNVIEESEKQPLIDFKDSFDELVSEYDAEIVIEGNRLYATIMDEDILFRIRLI